MKDTNAIEKALQIKINEECRQIVDRFITDLDKLSNKYGGTMFYDFKKDAAADAPAKPVPTTITSNFLLLFGFTRFIENLWFSHFSSNGPEGTRESSTVLLLVAMI